MSYSFSVQAKTKKEAKEAVAVAFAQQVMTYQPEHAADMLPLLNLANAQIDAMHDNPEDTRGFHVSCYGSLGWIYGEGGTRSIESVNTSCTVSRLHA